MLTFTEDIGGCADELTVAVEGALRAFSFREGERGQRRPVFFKWCKVES